MQQQTIQRDVAISGIGLHSGREVSIHIIPAPCDTGIVFVRTDLPDRPEIQAHVRHIHQRMRCTALVANGAEVHTTEHFLATFLALGIDNARVEIGGAELPGMGGNALPIYHLLKEAGIRTQEKEAREIILSREIVVTDGKAQLNAFPYEKGLKLEYFLDYDVPYMPKQQITFEITEETFAKEIAPARTFALKAEVDALLKFGLGKGANLENTLVIDEKGNVMENRLRFPDEFARHKMLDLLGDIALIGHRLKAHIQAYRSGHTSNVLMSEEIYRSHVQ